MAKYDVEEYASAVRSAIVIMQEEYKKDCSDGGTCNLDAPYLQVTGMRESTADKISAKSTIRVRISKHLYHGRILMLPVYQGQASLRTRCAEAAYKYLKEQGLDAGMWYQID